MPSTELLSLLPLWLAMAAVVFLLAGVVKGVVGLGLPTVAMALLALRLVPAEAAALLVVPSLATNVWQTRPWGTLGPLGKRLAGLLLGVCAGTWAGASPHVPRRMERWLGLLAGALTGFVTAATGVFVVPAVPYLQSLGLQRDAFVQAMGLSFSVSTLALAVGLAGNASLPGAMLGWSVLMLAPALLGMALGGWLRRRLSPLWFRRCLMAGLLALGGHMVLAG
ncbi:TSUP family transporter [Alicycliphilus denitrificans]|uniref:TSUP family transporter n=1 Tax=Alicycliphilus denitrificans TaxID=179636 RepID=UPI000C9EFCA9|nr:TSUP family transporter [Alicycliphilus denitrificans]